MDEDTELDLLAMLYHFQRIGHLCDATVASCEGIEFPAHAGVLAATSSLLAQELSKCDCGNYYIIMPLTSGETQMFIDYAYTGQTYLSQIGISNDLDRFCDISGGEVHERRIISKLIEFSENGLFCNMDWYTITGDVQPCHSFLMAAKYDFMSNYIKTGSLVSVNVAAINYEDTQMDDQVPTENQWPVSAPFPNSSNLHEDWRDINKLYLCEVCNKSFTRQASLNRHKLIHTGAKPYECETCNKSFNQLWNLKKHEQTHTNDSPGDKAKQEEYGWAASDVDRASSESDHVAQDGNKSYFCDTCHKGFAHKGTLNRHKLVHTGLKPYECETCHKTFRQLANLKNHQVVHSDIKPYVCETCHKSFARLANLKNHQIHHNDVKPYSCGTCEKTFTQPAHLKDHELTHAEVKPHQCDICHKRFTLLRHLTNHQLHHTGVKDFVCETCDKRFTMSWHLKQHQLIHSGVKPYECDTCQKRFTMMGDLKKHLLIHTRVKPYTCDRCDKRFTLAGNLKQHQLVHSDVKPYECETCHKQFKRPGQLKIHEVSHTKHTSEKPDVNVTQ